MGSRNRLKLSFKQFLHSRYLDDFMFDFSDKYSDLDEVNKLVSLKKITLRAEITYNRLIDNLINFGTSIFHFSSGDQPFRFLCQLGSSGTCSN